MSTSIIKSKKPTKQMQDHKVIATAFKAKEQVAELEDEDSNAFDNVSYCNS